MPATTQTPGGANYTGVDLWALLNGTTGIATSRASPQRRHPTLRMAAVATASDGYQVLLAPGEPDPSCGGRNALLAYSTDGGPLNRSGPIRPVVAGGGKAGSSVSNLRSVRVFSVDEGGAVAR